MDQELSSIKDRLRQRLPLLAERYHVASLGLFGSFVRHEQQAESDLDILVSFEQAPSLLKFIELKDYLSSLLGIQVDLVDRDSLRRQIGQRILEEAVPV